MLVCFQWPHASAVSPCLIILLATGMSACKPKSSTSIKALTSVGQNESVDLTQYSATIEDYTEARREIDSGHDSMGYPSFDEMRGGVTSKPAYADKNQSYYQLPLQEMVSVQIYTGLLYRPINTVLRSGDWRLMSNYIGIIKTAASGLNKMPTYKGPVTRGVNFSSKGELTHLDDYQVGRVVVETGFLSTTTKDSDTTPFCGNTKMVIDAISGHSVAWLSASPDEEEVMFAPGSEFKVTDRQVVTAPTGNTSCISPHTVVTLTQVPSGTAAQLIKLPANAGNATTNCAAADAAQAIDGDMSSVWACGQTKEGAAISAAAPLWLAIDFGAAYALSNVRLIWTNNYGHVPIAVQGWDGAGWTNVTTVTASADAPQTIYFDKALTTAKLRLAFTALPPANGANQAVVSLHEIEVFGTKL